MDLSLLAKLSGTLVNVAAVLLGSLLGVFLQNRLSSRMQKIIVQGVGLVTLFIGFSMAASLRQGGAGVVDGVILGLLALVTGGLLGEAWLLEDRLEQLGDIVISRI